MPGKVIFFDFDKTLTLEDTILPAAYFFLRWRKNKVKFPFAAASYIAFRLKIISEYKFKEMLCAYMVKGLNDEEVYVISSAFFASISSRRFFNPQIIEILKDHNKKGEKIYIVSSNFGFLLEPLKDFVPVDGIFATEAEKKDKVYSGKISGDVCVADNKLLRAAHLIPGGQTICYGDSEGDFALMNACSKSYLVKHKKKSIPRKIIHLLRTMSGISADASENSFRIVPFKN